MKNKKTADVKSSSNGVKILNTVIAFIMITILKLALGIHTKH